MEKEKILKELNKLLEAGRQEKYAIGANNQYIRAIAIAITAIYNEITK